MHTRRFPQIYIAIAALTFLLIPATSGATVTSLTLGDIYTTLPGESARIGLFGAQDRIDLLFQFDLEADSDETARLTWDVYNRYGRVAFSGEREYPCGPGRNSILIENSIPTDIGIGTQVYDVYASITVSGIKTDTEFEIRIESLPRSGSYDRRCTAHTTGG